MSNGNTDTLSGTESSSLRSSSPETQVYRTIRRSPRRFDPVAAIRPLRAVNRASLVPDASEDNDEQRPSSARRPLHRAVRDAERNVPIGQNDTSTTDGGTQHHGAMENLRRTVARQKRQLQLKANSLERAREELDNSKQQIAEMENELEEKAEELERLRKSEKQYRNWWLNEIQFTKLLLNKTPEPNRDIELQSYLYRDAIGAQQDRLNERDIYEISAKEMRIMQSEDEPHF
ncbi:hypothetical protein BKA70DRAFT_1225958 [Coprinopsis sp. MPI-PUGE-AT-0042]|nr:hypothetical protein BKA70DRAFT_1225958 [Coprinopsis sp. MPI-PUGE-AT-0042]